MSAFEFKRVNEGRDVVSQGVDAAGVPRKDGGRQQGTNSALSTEYGVRNSSY